MKVALRDPSGTPIEKVPLEITVYQLPETTEVLCSVTLIAEDGDQREERHTLTARVRNSSNKVVGELEMPAPRLITSNFVTLPLVGTEFTAYEQGPHTFEVECAGSLDSAPLIVRVA